jgi:hypothetical protein
VAGNRIHKILLDRTSSEALARPAVYPALFERATSDPSQSRRRGPHLAEHENIKAEVVPRFPLACTARQEHRDTVRSLPEPEEKDMSTIRDVT